MQYGTDVLERKQGFEGVCNALHAGQIQTVTPSFAGWSWKGTPIGYGGFTFFGKGFYSDDGTEETRKSFAKE